MVGLSKAIIQKYGITKKAWQMQRLRGRTKWSGRAQRGNVRMARKRSYRPRWRRSRFHRRDNRIPIITTIGAVGSLFAPQGRPGAMSLGQWIVEAVTGQRSFNPSTDLKAMAFDAMGQYIGYNPDYGWGIPWGTVTIVGSALASKAVARVGGNRALSKIPLIGRYIKF